MTTDNLIKKNVESDTVHTGAITLRSLLLGLTSVLLISFLVPFFQYTMASSMLGADHFHISALFLAFFYVIIFNVILARWKKSWALTPQEFIIPLAMGMAASGLTTNGMGAPFISTLMAPHLLATPENQWAEYFYPHLEPWATVTNQGNALLVRPFPGLYGVFHFSGG